MARRLLLFLSGSVFTAALAAYLGTPGAYLAPALAVSGACAVIWWITGLRSVRSRVPALHTFDMRLRALYERGLAMQPEVRGDGGGRTFQELRPRLQAWDDDFWTLLEAELPDQVPFRRAVQPTVEGIHDDPRLWPMDARRFVGARLALIAHLLLRER